MLVKRTQFVHRTIYGGKLLAKMPFCKYRIVTEMHGAQEEFHCQLTIEECNLYPIENNSKEII